MGKSRIHGWQAVYRFSLKEHAVSGHDGVGLRIAARLASSRALDGDGTFGDSRNPGEDSLRGG